MKLGLFNADQVRHLCKISDSQLRYWNKTKVFQPEVQGRAESHYRAYTFRDLVGLRTVSILRNKYNVDLKDLRMVEQKLKADRTADWPNLSFYVGEDRHVYFIDPKSNDPVAMHPMGQRPLFKMQAIARGVERNLTRMQKRNARQIGKIDQNRHVLQNSPFVAGTRIPTATINRLERAGYSAAEIVRQFPRLTIEDVKAATMYESLKLKKVAS